MCSFSASSVLLLILNVVQLLFGFLLCAASIWYFIELYGITSLRNANYNLLNNDVYWPQAMPWVFVVVGVLVICVSCCGFAGAKTKSKRFVMTFVTFEIIAVLLLITSIAFTYLYVDETAKFIKVTLADVFENTKNDKVVAEAFGEIERRLRCCGNAEPQEHKKWRSDYPISCCDTDASKAIQKCEFSNVLANARYGCSPVVVNYAKMATKALAAMSAVVAFVGLLNVVAAVGVSAGLKKKKKLWVNQEQSETKKAVP